MSLYLVDECREYNETSRGRKKESQAQERSYQSLSISPPKSQAYGKAKKVVRGLDAKHFGEIERQTQSTFALAFQGFKPFDVTLNYHSKHSHFRVTVDDEAPLNDKKRSNQKHSNDPNNNRDRLRITISVPTRNLFEIEVFEEEGTILLIEYEATGEPVSDLIYSRSNGADDVLGFSKGRFEKKIDTERVKVWLEFDVLSFVVLFYLSSSFPCLHLLLIAISSA
jgi:hypothetical protein